jgi:hypothetical protein
MLTTGKYRRPGNGIAREMPTCSSRLARTHVCTTLVISAHRASQDQAQELERVRIGMLAKGKEVPPPLFTHADNQPKGHHSGFGAKMPRGCGAVNNFSEPQ